MASYYEDYLSKWYVSDNNKHSTFINQIKDSELSQKVQVIIDTKQFDSTFDTRFEFPVDIVNEDGEVTKTNNEKFSVWYDENPTKHKLYRLTPGENSSKTSSSSGSSSSNSSSSKSDFKPKGYIDGNSHDCVLLEDYKKMKFPTVALSAKDKTPNNYMTMNNGKKEIWIWIGTYVYNNN